VRRTLTKHNIRVSKKMNSWDLLGRYLIPKPWVSMSLRSSLSKLRRKLEKAKKLICLRKETKSLLTDFVSFKKINHNLILTPKVKFTNWLWSLACYEWRTLTILKGWSLLRMRCNLKWMNKKIGMIMIIVNWLVSMKNIKNLMALFKIEITI
jgi:hypothetical protein